MKRIQTGNAFLRCARVTDSVRFAANQCQSTSQSRPRLGPDSARQRLHSVPTTTGLCRRSLKVESVDGIGFLMPYPAGTSQTPLCGLLVIPATGQPTTVPFLADVFDGNCRRYGVVDAGNSSAPRAITLRQPILCKPPRLVLSPQFTTVTPAVISLVLTRIFMFSQL